MCFSHVKLYFGEYIPKNFSAVTFVVDPWFFYNKLICIFNYSKTSTNSLICPDGTVRPSRESKSKYSLSVALSLSLPTMIREHISHWKCLINLFVIYPKIVYATSLLSGDKKSLFISDLCWAKMLSILSFFWTGLRFSSQKLMFLLKETNRSIFSQYSILLEDSPKIYHPHLSILGKSNLKRVTLKPTGENKLILVI